MGRLCSSARGIPRTMTPLERPLAVASAWALMTGATWRTPGAAAAARASREISAPGMVCTSMNTWPLTPRMRDSSVSRKPFITDMVMMRAATASVMATTEMTEMSATPPCWRLARR